MKKSFLLAFLLASFLPSETFAQQKYMSKKIIPELQELTTSCNIKIEASTKTFYFFTTKKEFGTLTIAKGEESYYYLMIKYVALPHKEDLTGIIHLLLSNGEQLNLSICGIRLDRQSGNNATIISDYNPNAPVGTNPIIYRTIKTGSNSLTYCLYEISRDDLQKLSENEITNIIIDTTVEKLMYDTQISPRKYHKTGARSILNI